MSQPESRPPVLIELRGPEPAPGTYWCATCCILYLGEVSADPAVQETAQKIVEDAIEHGDTEVILAMPPSWRKIRQAITYAPSVYFPYPMPVCWLHLQGAKPGGDANNKIIPGKAV